MRRRLALALAAFEVGDLVVTTVSPKYGPAHLDHLGVPHWLRPVLPWIKSVATVSLVVTSRAPRLRAPVAAALVSYYSAASTFHVLAGDGLADVGPAVACAAISAALV